MERPCNESNMRTVCSRVIEKGKKADAMEEEEEAGLGG
jgi:hypothetical protein